MLKDEDRIFTNIYGMHDRTLAGAKARGHWDGTAAIIARGRDRIIDEMEEVIRDIEGGTLDENTLQKEERILSRLLDAQRSIHSRDYEKKRTSETAAEMYSDARGVPESRPQSQMLREEIRRAMALKAPGEFEDLIRLYFRALAEEATTRRTGEE